MVTARIAQRPANLHRCIEDLRQLDASFLQGNFALSQPFDIEQVVDETNQISNLPLQNLACAIYFLGAPPRPMQQFDGIGHCAERAAQLVSQGGEELVFVAVDLAQRLLRQAASTDVGVDLQNYWWAALVGLVENPTAGDGDPVPRTTEMDQFALPLATFLQFRVDLLQRTQELGFQQFMCFSSDGVLAAVAIDAFTAGAPQ